MKKENTPIQQLIQDVKSKESFSFYNQHHINYYLDLEKKHLSEAFYATCNVKNSNNFNDYFDNKYK